MTKTHNVNRPKRVLACTTVVSSIFATIVLAGCGHNEAEPESPSDLPPPMEGVEGQDQDSAEFEASDEPQQNDALPPAGEELAPGDASPAPGNEPPPAEPGPGGPPVEGQETEGSW